MKKQPATPWPTHFNQDSIMIYHSLKGAVIFGILLAGFGAGTIAMFFYLKNQMPSTSVPIPLIVGFSFLFIVMLHILKHLLRDAGKVAITIGCEGVKFDRYSLINWNDIEDIYVVEDTDSSSSLQLKVKEGVTFLPKGPRLLLRLAKKAGLHRRVDISGYGSLSMPDKDIHMLLEAGLQYFKN